ncbi:LysR family transcriptional regulator [Bordetella hinzii]|jgi:DNA-binding transcriptional LysR family regulator|uniref:LysR family transcriptional regulator n=2 Tax=Bordetella hinzii TaxID=103855 RepID=A0AAN1RWA5_9BORD|nr:LysR family transcriptional regulator [Bordetella hinzii]AKQ57255.1 HTH-type transcriptional regulator DmlR [Bordetella hinzii]AKQ61722.1 HTH-type transcriptional regulator DmlR [Bordetella hinzii]AZW17331.1 LysR family transcriptional regulator [Bordetella hinzii]KCB22862.1 LysR substrate-binding domain protein [Bordetella hinzii OH87 BAL007II]KCB27178.1 LysR substrate-binding domain protein [Bordetella hinzii CA90 BAL1384]
MQDLNDLFYFSQVVDQGGFSAAARVLDIPKSRLSRRISQLEERLGVRLLQRTTRRLRLTTAGERYLHYCREMTASARAAEEAMRQLQTQPSGPVVVSCPISIAQQLLAPLLPEFMDTWPEVSIQMLATNRRVDLINEGVDLALRVRTRLDTDAELVVRQLGAASGTLVASPAYLQRHGAPDSPEDLVHHMTLSFNDPQTEVVWSLHNGEGQERAITVAPRLCCNDFIVLTEAAVRGRGIALLPSVATQAELRRGELVPVLPDWRSPEGIVHCIYPSRRGMIPAVRAFLDFLFERLAPSYERMGMKPLTR